MDGSSKMREATTPAKAREMTQGEKRESLISRLQVAIYVVNFIAVCFVSSVMAYSLWSVVGRMEAAEFLRNVKIRPWKPDQMISYSILGYLAFVMFGSLSRKCEGEWEELRPLFLEIEIVA